MRRQIIFASPLLGLLTSVFALACVPPQQEDPNAIAPSNPQPMAPTSAVIAASDSPPTAPTSTAPAGPYDTQTVPLSIEIHSDCSDNVPLFLGETPKFGSGTKTSISPNTTTSFPRNSDGTLTLWIMDDQENGLASVHITKRMKKVEIGRSCRTLDAN
jgi:hypothetical protein